MPRDRAVVTRGDFPGSRLGLMCPRNEKRNLQWRSRIPSARRVRGFQARLLSWYDDTGRSFQWREPGADDYVRVVSEVLLQRTRAERVASVFDEFLSEFPGWGQLADATELDLQRFLKPLGLWRRRATALRALSATMVSREGKFPSSRDDLESLPAVGQYVASAVLVLVHGVPAPLLDVNMSRVLERVFGERELADIRYDPFLQDLARRVVTGERTRELNWAILDLGALVCTPRNPRCEQCPHRRVCGHARRGRTRTFKVGRVDSVVEEAPTPKPPR